MLTTLIAITVAASFASHALSVRDKIVSFEADERSLSRKYNLEYSAEDRTRMDSLYKGTLIELGAVDFNGLGDEGKLDYVFLRNALENREADLRHRAADLEELRPLLPFWDRVIRLELDRRLVGTPDYEGIATNLTKIAEEAKGAQAKISQATHPGKLQAYRAVRAIDSFKTTLGRWFTFYNRYDPLFSWWAPTPYKAAIGALDEYKKALGDQVGMKDRDPSALIGQPVGRAALVDQLKGAMIAYSPEELLEIADREYAWCEEEMLKASREMGYGDDWKKALAKVRLDHVAPGAEPQLIKELAEEGIRYVTQNDLVTVPPVAAEMWTMDMMTPERQLVNPFFTGGRTISVSFPTNDMSQEQKLMSLQANNRHFDRATVFHELIPGHCLQGYYEARSHPYRSALESNPFWIEGWAFYWEMLLYDRGFFKTPEDRVGSLFWRMHRCARIVFSLKFHLGLWTPEKCVQYLVDKVGHERFTAEGEVRRSILGDYPPLYQLAYMVGALQFRQLHRELVDSGKMKDREFHDRILEGNQMPVELVRAMLGQEKLTKDFRGGWRFYPLPAGR